MVEATADRLKKIIADLLGRDLNLITADSELVADLGADSLDLLNLVFEVESQFGVTLPLEEINDAVASGNSGLHARVGAIAAWIDDHGEESARISA